MVLLFFFNNFNKIYSIYFIIIGLIMSIKYYWVDWMYIMFEFGSNIYSNWLSILSLWIGGLLMLSLDSKFKIYLNYILVMILVLNFMMMNLIFYYLMFEVGVMIMFYMILEWGSSSNRVLASFYMLFYTMIFSLPSLFIMFYIYKLFGSFSFKIMELLNNEYMDLFIIMYFIFMFLVKIPMYLFHQWLLKAHVEAPYYVSMILASIMLKLGSYGLLRMMMIFLSYFKMVINNLIMLNILGMLILSLMCLRMLDMKMLIAISSVVHMGLLLMSMIMGFEFNLIGGYLMMISHGFSSSGLFFLVNMIYKETNSRLLVINKGMFMYMPSMSLMWFMLCSTNMAAPISLNLISEIILILGSIMWMKYIFVILIMYCLFSFLYSLYLYLFIQHGKNNFKMIYNGFMIEYLIILFHWLPLNLFIFNLEILI
uniref:NADH-ubiquinone oxidoreductase chain 4 n=1 Tax=Xylocopa appendiculata TaxID=135683 RepID=A0A343DRE8_9HYME|nr:NADH dehydrogenase subunit 4 [Xylocopa appendiculata]